MNLIDGLVEALAPAGLRLRKAQPRGPGWLSMELETRDGVVCAGQWHRDIADAGRVASLVRDRFGTDAAEVWSHGRLLVQHAGADRRLPVLARLVGRPGAKLVAHRPERRAVVRLGSGCHVKVVRPGRTDEVVTPLRLIRPKSARVPEVLSADHRRGLVTVTTIPGRTLLECVSDPRCDDGDLRAVMNQVGATVRDLHSQSVRLDRGVHDGTAEVVAARRWLTAAADHHLLAPRRWEHLLTQVSARLPAAPAGRALLHRDLHDKQIVLSPGAQVGLLDLDLATRGDPAIDVANLLAHLDLRHRQGLTDADRATRCARALLEGYDADDALLGRLAPYVALTRLRLAGVYSFRPTPVGLVADLLDAAGRDEAPWR